MSYSNYHHQDIHHPFQSFTPQAPQPTATSYHSPSYKQHTTQYITPELQSDATSQWSDTNSTMNLSETTSLPRSEKERLVREEIKGDRRRCDKWKQWAREQNEEDRSSFAVENARREEYRCRREALDRQTREFGKLKAENDRDWRVCLQELEADEQWKADRQSKEADRRERLRTSSSRNNRPRREHTTRYALGTSGRQFSYTPLSDEVLIRIAKEGEKRSKRRH